MNIESIRPRDFLSVHLGPVLGFGIVESVNLKTKKVTFSKYDTLVGDYHGRFRGILEGVTLSFSEDRFDRCGIFDFFNTCQNDIVTPNFEIADFFKPGELIATGAILEKGGCPYEVIGTFVESRSRSSYGGRGTYIIHISNLMLMDGMGRLVGTADDYVKERYSNFNLSDQTRLLTDENILSYFKKFDIYKDFMIDGTIL